MLAKACEVPLGFLGPFCLGSGLYGADAPRLSLRARGVLAAFFRGPEGLVEVSSVSSQPPAVLPLLVAASFVFSFWRLEMSGADQALKRKVVKSSDGFTHSSCLCAAHRAFSIGGCGSASPLPVGQVLLGLTPILQMEKRRLGVQRVGRRACSQALEGRRLLLTPSVPLPVP